MRGTAAALARAESVTAWLVEQGWERLPNAEVVGMLTKLRLPGTEHRAEVHQRTVLFCNGHNKTGMASFNTTDEDLIQDWARRLQAAAPPPPPPAAPLPKREKGWRYSKWRELIDARERAHAAFDQLWKFNDNREYRGAAWRGVCYQWLAHKMGMTAEQCHFGKMSIEQCERALLACLGVKPRAIAAWSSAQSRACGRGGGGCS